MFFEGTFDLESPPHQKCYFALCISKSDEEAMYEFQIACFVKIHKIEKSILFIFLFSLSIIRKILLLDEKLQKSRKRTFFFR